jgi:hypothetical protein
MGSGLFADFTFPTSANRAAFIYVLIRVLAICQYAINVDLETMAALRAQGINFFFFLFFHDQSPPVLKLPDLKGGEASFVLY